MAVEQVDQEAAADLMFECAPYLGDCAMKASVELALRQAFAARGERERERCAGVADEHAADFLARMMMNSTRACEAIATAIREGQGDGLAVRTHLQEQSNG